MSGATRVMAMRRLLLLPLAICLGVILAMGQAPWSIVPATVAAALAWFWLWPFVTTCRRRMLIAWGIGFGYFATVMHWIVFPFLVDASLHGWMAPFGLILMAGGLALFWMVAGIAAHPVALAGALALAELARGMALTGLPWGQVSYIWIGTPVYHAAAWIGPYGVTLLSLLILAWLARKGLTTLVGVAFGVVLSLPIWQADLDVRPDGPIVRMVQPNADQALKWDPAHRDRFFEGALAQSVAPGPAGAPPQDLIVWPETSLPVALDRAGGYLSHIKSKVGQTPVLLGAVRWGEIRPRNSAVLIENGAATQIYDKRHLVPFGEYTPLWGFASFLGFDRITGMQGPGFAPGDGATSIAVPGIGELRVLICYEGIFPHEILGPGPRPRALALITNDAWFGPWAGPAQHLVQAQARAIETGLPVIRVANTGFTAMINADGRITSAIPFGQLAFADAPLPPAKSARIYTRLGDWPTFLAALLIVLFGAHRSGIRD